VDFFGRLLYYIDETASNAIAVDYNCAAFSVDVYLAVAVECDMCSFVVALKQLMAHNHSCELPQHFHIR
jgi:hypothetical protein